MTEFWKIIGSKLAEHWLVSWLTPTLLFWAAGLTAWLFAVGLHTAELKFNRFGSLSEAPKVMILVAVLTGITVSAWLVEWLTIPVLRAMEGYWPQWLRPVTRRLSGRQWSQIESRSKRWHQLAKRRELAEVHVGRSAEEAEEYIALDRLAMYDPARREDCLPTRLGNILRAAERRPSEKYGLDAIICWPRLWLLLPPDVKEELTHARDLLDMLTRIWIWSVLLIIWSYWSIVSLAIGLLGALAVYRIMLHAARIYGELIEASYDVYRTALYRAVRWPLPKNPAEEPKQGTALTIYLWRGSDGDLPNFSSVEVES